MWLLPLFMVLMRGACCMRVVGAAARVLFASLALITCAASWSQAAVQPRASNILALLPWSTSLPLQHHHRAHALQRKCDRTDDMNEYYVDREWVSAAPSRRWHVGSRSVEISLNNLRSRYGSPRALPRHTCVVEAARCRPKRRSSLTTAANHPPRGFRAPLLLHFGARPVVH
jgi:hypothetical protein